MSSSSPNAVMPNPGDTLGMDDLARWMRAEPSLAVLGHPVAHSVSPPMHNAALAHLRETHPQLAGWEYFKFGVPPESLAAALTRLRALDFRGVNLTLPHKVAAAALADRPGEEVRGMGAANTLKPAAPGGWEAYNTDGYGLSSALRHDLDAGLRGASVVLLGAGGAARGAAWQCLRENCASLLVLNRDKSAREALFGQLDPRHELRPKVLSGFHIEAPPYDEWPDDVLVINATAVGLQPGDLPVLDCARLPSGARVFDMIYRRDGATPLVAAARARGLRAADGLSMLVWQGVRSLEIWTGLVLQDTEVPRVMLHAACDALGLPRRDFSGV